MERQGSCVDDRRDADRDVDDDQVKGHDAAGRRMVAVLEIFGDGVDPAAQELGKEEQGHDDQSDSRHPLVAGYGEAGDSRSLPGHPDKVLGRDVGGDERKPDQRPEERAAGQKEILPRFLPPALVHAHADDKGKEGDKYGQVKPVHVHGALLFPILYSGHQD